ncbi:MAG: zinc metallopeptidase [Clostridiales bacterium]|nr:zinc metallopeptidase [Clostridiales bacterium]
MEFLGYYVCGILVLVTIFIALGAQAKVHSAYNKYKKEVSPLDITGADLARKLAEQNHISINLRSCSGQLSDHYDPRDKSLNISQENFNSKSVAAHAIVAHEFGHALQDAENYAPLKVRQATVKIANAMSTMLVPMIILGLLFELFLFAGVGNVLIYIYIGLYSVSFVVSLVTLPVEFNASRRAKECLTSLGVTGQDQDGVSDVLNAAAWTYVASMLVSLAYLLRLLALLRIFSRD